MFLENYLNSTYLDLVFNNYEEEYLKSLDQENFDKIYRLLKDKNFYFIDDIVLNYLELFEIKVECVSKSLVDFESIVGEDYVNYIGNNMSSLDKIIDLAIKYSRHNGY